jgi:hypothetical protein
MSSFFEYVIDALQDPIFLAMLCLCNSLLFVLFARLVLSAYLRINFLAETLSGRSQSKNIIIVFDNRSFGFRLTPGANDND